MRARARRRPSRTRSAPRMRVGFDHAGRSARDVVVVDAEEAGVLGRLAADEGGAGLGAAARRCRATMSAMRSGNTLPHAM